MKVGYQASNKINMTKQILEDYSHRHLMAIRVMPIREVAHRRPAESLSAAITNFLEREKTPAWYEEYKRSKTKPPHVLHGRVRIKITRSLTDVIHDIINTDENHLDKL
jgi:hypothetical protein